MMHPLIDHLFTFDQCICEGDCYRFTRAILKRDIGPFRFNTILDSVSLDLDSGIMTFVGDKKKFETRVHIEIGFPDLSLQRGSGTVLIGVK